METGDMNVEVTVLNQEGSLDVVGVDIDPLALQVDDIRSASVPSPRRVANTLGEDGLETAAALHRPLDFRAASPRGAHGRPPHPSCPQRVCLSAGQAQEESKGEGKARGRRIALGGPRTLVISVIDGPQRAALSSPPPSFMINTLPLPLPLLLLPLLLVFGLGVVVDNVAALRVVSPLALRDEFGRGGIVPEGTVTLGARDMPAPL